MDRRELSSHGAAGAARLSWIAALLLFSGCDLLRSDQFLPLWALLPFVIILATGGIFVFRRRRGQLERWDLRREAHDPGVSGIASQLIGGTAVVFLSFAIYNGLLEGADRLLRLENVGLWLLGSVVGVALALYLGLRGAERSLRAGRSRRS